MGKKRPKLTAAERLRREHRLDEDLEHRTHVGTAGKLPMGRTPDGEPIRHQAYLARCSCGWAQERKSTDQAYAAKAAIAHQRLVRQAATQRERASTIASHPLATVRGSGMASAAR